jgi:hypothetical protein
MTTEPLSPEALRETLKKRFDDLSARGIETDFLIGVQGFAGLALPHWKRAIDTATPFQLNELARALSEIETKIVLREKRDEQWRQEDERRARLAQPLTEDDPEYIVSKQLADAARKAAERRASVGGQLEELIRLQARTVELLEGLVKR